MKKGIHPKYMTCTVKCACGNKFKTRSTVGDLHVDKVTFMDKELTNGGDNLAMKAAVTSEQLKSTLGIDLPALLNKMAGKANGNGAAVKWLDGAAVTEVG